MTYRIGLVYSFDSSPWVSCQKIISNLLLCYAPLQKEHELIHLNFNTEDSAENWTSIKNASDLGLHFLIFLDHKPHPLQFLEPFLNIKETSVETKLIFHLFGDFSLNLDKWQNLFKLIEGTSVYFLAASARQKNMLSEFIPEQYLGVCPFPVHPDEFNFSTPERDLMRNTFGIKKDETLFLYTGRLSFQKQIHLLIQNFAEWRKNNNANARLMLVGEADGIGRPFEDRREWNGEYFHQLLDFLADLEPEERSHIEFVGFKSNRELSSYYCGADYFISLSVHHDEDYGMSCAEALATGLPLIISNWAGFASFRKPELHDSVQLLPVELTDQGPSLAVESIGPQLSLALQKNNRNRQDVRERSMSYFGIDAVSKLVTQLLDQTLIFEGCKHFIKETAYLEKYFGNKTFYDSRDRKYNDKYLRMYKHYVQNS